MILWYRIGDGSLGVDSEDAALAERFESIYGGCAEDDAGPGPRVRCEVRRATPGQVQIRFDDPEPLDEARFIDFVFPGRGYSAGADGAVTVVRLPDSAHVVRIVDGMLVAPAEAGWQPLVANLAVNRVMRLQRDVIFFHAASVRIGGQGVMACGPKRSGKTTLALGFAARGHFMLGDETAAVRTSDRTLLPVRRSLATRAGPRSDAATALVARSGGRAERFPDGETRLRLTADAISPGRDPDRTPLTTLLILRSIVPVTRTRAAVMHPGLLGALTPLAPSVWERSAGETAVRLMRLLAGVRVYEVDSGPPDEVLTRIEQLMEGG